MITIKRIDGTPIMEVQERDDSKYTRVLMGEHSVRIRFDWNALIPLPYGSFIEWRGKRFSLWGEYIPVQREGAFEYDIPFEAEERELNNYLFFYLSAGKMEHQWKLTAPIEQALREVQGNLDRIHGKGAWVIRNQVGTTPTKLLEFDSTSVFDALTKIAEAYGTEWRAEGRTLFFGRMSEGERVRLSLGGEASRFEPQGDTAQLISRLYAFGSSRNVKSGKRLTLPDDTPFISGTLRGKEAVKIFDDVYPKYNGTISSVSFRSVKEGKIYGFADSALKITQDKLLAGQTLKATFESGALNGLTFDLSITSQGYEIVPNNEYGGRLPSDTLKPAVGDKYVPHGFDIDLVGKEYVPRARTTLKEKAFRWLQENNEDTRDVEVVLNPVTVAERSISITIGKPITLVNALAGGDKVGYITKMEYPLYSPESVTIVVGKAKPLGFIERLKQEGKDEASLIVHELVTPQLNAQQKAVLDVQAMITDAESSATAKTTQALSDAKAYTDGKTNDALEEVARINTAIRTLSIGGRNYIRNSSQEFKMKGLYKNFNLSDKLKEGSEVTISAYIVIHAQPKVNDDKARLKFVLTPATWITDNWGLADLPTGVSEGIVQKTITLTRDVTRLSVYPNYYYLKEDKGAEVTVKWIKLEYGNKATDYTEAPEDTADAIKRAETESKSLAVSEAGKAQANAIAEASRRDTALKTELEGKVSALVASVTTIQGDLQRQIDKQVEMYWGEQPPTGRIGWTEADDTKHEGDTYTVRPPEGVTITPQNAKQYPNVGKSWRWHSNGWIEIADTDVTRALALAGEAKASADGKVTHFRGSSIPTGYKQGDLWTLTSAWNSFKQGSILTATQDEVIGQYNPTHWKEEVRYTDDTAIRTLSIGGRNLVRRFDAVKQDGYCLGCWLFPKPEQWQAGLEYTLSFNLGTTHNDPLVWLYVDKYSRGIARIYPQGEPKRMDDGLFYGKYTLTFRPTQEDIDRGRPRDGWDGFRLYLGHSSNGRNANDPKAQVDKLKLEKGNKATDYTEAPEDVADALKKVDTDSTAKANQALNDAKAFANTKTQEANTYTNSKASEVKAYASQQASTALNDAKAFAREEDEKRVRALRAEMMQDYLRRVIKDGSTLIKGGLLATNVIALKSTNGKVSSYIDGNEANNIAFATGVTDAFTANEKRAVEITHDGNARFGQMHLNGQDGVLSFAPIGSAESYLNIGGVARNLDDIVDNTLGGDSRGGSAEFSLTNKGDVHKDNDHSDTSVIVDYFNIAKDGTLINFSGTYSLIVIQGLVDYSAPELMDSVLTANDIIKRETAVGALEVKLIKQGERGEEDRAQILYMRKSASEGGVYDDKYSYNITLEKGRYKVVANCYHFGSSLGESGTTAKVSIKTALTNKSTEVHIGNKAMYAVFGRENFLHVSEQGTTIKGRTDMPGVLAAGIAKTTGIVQNAYGAKVNRQGYAGAWCERQRDNSYKVYHSIGHSNYSVQVTVFGDSRDAGCVMDIQNYYFTCCFYNPVDTYKEQHNFTYLCIGPNTK